MIKFALRRNLLYPFQLIIWNFIRQLLSELIKNLYSFNNSFLYTFLMFFGEFISGGILFLYQKKCIEGKKEKKEKKYFMSIELLQNDEEEEDYFVPLVNKIKILILIFLATFFDAVGYIINVGFF